MGTSIVDNLAVHVTCISDDFLDKYLGTANGDYIKVYLYMLRHRGEQFSKEQAADSLNLTDNDIERALRYWEKQGVFGSSSGSVQDHEEETEHRSIKGRTAKKAAIKEEAFWEAEEEMDSLEGTVDDVQKDEEFNSILYIAKHLLPSLPSVRQVEVLKYMYKDLKMSSDVIEFLIEYCASAKKTTYKYMQAVAINWHEQGVVTVSQARELVKSIEDSKNKKQASRSVSKSSGKTNKFINLEQREVDYDSIVNLRTLNRMKNVTN
jgi:DnaD/phage-associated family protein